MLTMLTQGRRSTPQSPRKRGGQSPTEARYYRVVESSGFLRRRKKGQPDIKPGWPYAITLTPQSALPICYRVPVPVARRVWRPALIERNPPTGTIKRMFVERWPATSTGLSVVVFVASALQSRRHLTNPATHNVLPCLQTVLEASVCGAQAATLSSSLTLNKQEAWLRSVGLTLGCLANSQSALSAHRPRLGHVLRHLLLRTDRQPEHTVAGHAPYVATGAVQSSDDDLPCVCQDHRGGWSSLDGRKNEGGHGHVWRQCHWHRTRLKSA
jgi:hypothetical protein